MPGRKEAPQLESLALTAVGSYIKYIFHKYETEDRKYAEKMILNISETLFTSVPCYLSDKMAAVALTAINDLLDECSGMEHFRFFKRAFLLKNLIIGTTTNSFVKHIDLLSWPKVMRYVLNMNLHLLKGLEELNLGSGSGGWNTCESEKNIVKGVINMVHLKALCLSSDCTDRILYAVGDTCHSLQTLDVAFSRSVTNRSVTSLLCCLQLQKLNLFQTSITAEGFRDLLLGLPKLQDIGRFHEFGDVLNLLSQDHSVRFDGLRQLACCDMTEYHLQLLVRHCPLLSCVAIFHEHRIAHITILSALSNLTQLKFNNCDYFDDRIDALLQMCGHKLTYLHLDYVEQIDLNALISISQHCPHLTTFIINNCELIDQGDPHNTFTNERAFANLERLVCIAECLELHLKLLLSNCFNIQYIELSSTGLTDATMTAVFMRNQMKQLQELKIPYSINLSMQTVQLFMEHCKKLKTISGLTSWNSIASEEFDSFRKYVTDNNLDLNF